MKVVIIEDEKVTARDLKRTILALEPDIDVVAMLHSVEEGIKFFGQTNDIDLVFSDIQLGDGLSFEIFKTFQNHIPIIFCTAYNTYFAEAFQDAGIDYLLKPFTKATIEKALAKYQGLKARFTATDDDYGNMLGILENKLSPKRNAIIIRHREKIIPLEAASIAVMYVDGGATYAYTFNQERFLLNDNMESLEQSFLPLFFRANRQYLINRKAVKDASTFFNRKLLVNLTIPFKGQILVGKLKVSAFLAWLAQH